MSKFLHGMTDGRQTLTQSTTTPQYVKFYRTPSEGRLER